MKSTQTKPTQSKLPVVSLDRVLVKPSRVEKEGERISDGGIIIPTTAVKQKNEGIIMAMGPTCSKQFKVKDKIAFGEYSGVSVSKNGVDYLVISERDILCSL